MCKAKKGKRHPCRSGLKPMLLGHDCVVRGERGGERDPVSLRVHAPVWVGGRVRVCKW